MTSDNILDEDKTSSKSGYRAQVQLDKANPMEDLFGDSSVQAQWDQSSNKSAGVSSAPGTGTFPSHKKDDFDLLFS